MGIGDATYLRRFFSVFSQEEKDKVRGHAFYPSDYLSALMPEDVASVEILRSPHAGADFKIVSTAEAEKSEGVLRIITAKDIPQNLSFGNPKRESQKILAETKVRFKGEPIALIVGKTAAEARAAAQKIQVEWTPHPESSPRCAESVHFQAGSKNSQNLSYVETEFKFPSLHARYLEPESGWVKYESSRLTFWIGSLLSESQREWVSRALNISPSQLAAKEAPLGGQFGGRQQRELIVYLALASWLSQRSCCLLLKYQNQDIGSYGYSGRLKIGYDKEAKSLRSLEGQIHLDSGSYEGNSVGILKRTLEHCAAVYRFDQIDLQGKVFLTPTYPRRPFKSEGIAPITWVTEQLIDQVAKDVGETPLEFRERHIRDDLSGIAKVFNEMEKVEKPFRVISSADRNRPVWDEKFIEGRGFAFQAYQTARFDTPSEVEVSVQMSNVGAFTIRTSNMTLDLRLKNALAEVAASVLRTHPKAFTVEGEMRLEFEQARKRETYPELYYLAQAVWHAASGLRDKILALGKTTLQSEVELQEGAVVGKTNQRKMGFRELAFTNASVKLESSYVLRDIDNPPSASAAAVSRVSFHPLTGELQVNSVKVVVDAGPVFYRTGLEIEAEAAVAWVMAALFSSSVVRDQPIPTSLDEPEEVSLFPIEYPIKDLADQPAEIFGTRAVSDVIMAVILASLVNAIQDAKQMVLTEIPMAPEFMYPEPKSTKVHVIPFGERS
jgi:CO/xanthine dehydrogenase Mo-binding subunit